MSTPTEKGGSTSKSYFLSLEGCTRGETRPLEELVSRLAYNADGLIPAIAQDFNTGEVLMMAWMNKEALDRTLATGQMTYYSRSRQALWIKGETSGHYQKVVDLRFDCDGDTLLCRVIQQGSACHTGRKTCFYLKADPEAQLVHMDDMAGCCPNGDEDQA